MPRELHFSKVEHNEMKTKIQELIKEKVIEECDTEEGEFLNTVFLREKKRIPGEPVKYRFILNMKTLNKKFVEKIHHKLESLKTCLNLMEAGCFMASIDLKNAFHTIPVASAYTKFLKFEFENTLYKFLVLPMGFRDSPRLFCKILKPVLALLRKDNMIICLYIDDFYLQGNSFDECLKNVNKTTALLKALGFEISEKSMLYPSQSIQHLGFILSSINMTISLSQEKRDNIKTLIQNSINKKELTVREVACIVGTLIASFPAIEYGLAFHRELEFIKIEALERNYNFNNKVILNDRAHEELQWWLHEGIFMSTPISHGNPDIVIQTDSSGFAWGALVLGGEEKTQGLWDEKEIELDNNVLELKACLLGIQALSKGLQACHIQIQTDNTTALAYINHMGGTHSKECNNLAKKLILWCKERSIWVSATHIPGKDNRAADELSRKINENIEWKLNERIFTYICKSFGYPEIDLFASRINHQVSRYMSFFPDAKAFAIDAFSHKWDSFSYIFPPFNLIPRVLRKIREDKTKAIMVVPRWQGAAWFPQLRRMSIREPILLKNLPDLISLPLNQQKTHPLLPKMRLTAWLLSGKN